MKNTSKAKNALHLEILITLKRISPPISAPGQTTPLPSTWPSTRQISEAHDISIYKARTELLSMVENGLVIVSPCAINNSLRWLPRMGVEVGMEGGDNSGKSKSDAEEK
ncbi:hypothetical protein [Enterobacter sp. CC120223-11]|uniref:hypothetical protein n=1 Tax=Enterobacter sp. CC120223-11 TaxID=1378073 RepID=UPI001596F5A3|nr:hypothetical protein [Enterobacter sp. CC120223-11]